MATKNVTTLIDTLRKVFSGVSELRWKDGDVTDFTTVVWDKEVPILSDGLKFTQADPTNNTVKVLGQSKPWASMAQSGDVSLDMSIPAIADGILGWLYGTGVTITTKEETIGGKTGTFSGKGYKLIKKILEGTVMIISEDGLHALIIRHLKGSTAFDFSNPTSAPFAVKINSILSGEVETDDIATDFDLAFLDWVDKVVIP